MLRFDPFNFRALERVPYRKIWVWSPPVLLMALIFLMSSLSAPPDIPGDLSDVSAHVFVYAVLGVLVLRALANARWSGVTIQMIGWTFVVTVAYGISDEFHQRFVPGRMAEVRDLLADMVGALIGIAIVWTWSIVLSVRKPS